MMEQFRLETEAGELVTIACMPPFLEWPGVVIWGSRVFQLQTVKKTEDMTAYKEVFSPVVFSLDECKKMGWVKE